MSPKDFLRFFVPEGFDIEAFIDSAPRPKKNKKGKINGFYFFLGLRKHQLKEVDDVVKDKNQFLSKIDSEWRALSTHEKNRFKSIARYVKKEHFNVLKNSHEKLKIFYNFLTFPVP